MKKYISILLVICLFAALSATISAISPTTMINISSSDILANNSVTFTVNLTDCHSASVGIMPDYDKSAFELVSGEILVTGAALTDFSDGCAVIAFASDHNFNGDVFRFVLKAKSSINSGDYTVKCDVQVEGYDLTTPTVTIHVQDEEKWKLGDINGDDSVNNKDVVALFKYVSGGNVDVKIIALDINGDGSVNNKDVVALFKYVSGGNIQISDKPYIPV